MVDSLAYAWAEDNQGASIWSDPTVRFLDPFTKSGVFLREITGRLTAGLEATIPDLQKRVDHVLTKHTHTLRANHQPAEQLRRTRRESPGAFRGTTPNFNGNASSAAVTPGSSSFDTSTI